MITTNDIQAILDGKTNVVTTDGDKIGSVGQVYLDDVTGEPTWVTVKTGLFGSSESFVPVDDATFAGEELRVPYSKDQVKDAPRVDADQNISPAEEDELYRYYGTQQGSDSYRTVREREGVDTTATAGVAGAAGTQRDVAHDRTADRATTDTQGTTLHAEDVHIGTQQVGGGKARLRKYTVTENVTKTVPVTHEEVRLERVPAGADDTVRDGDRAFADEGGEIVGEVDLKNEEVVVDRDVRATERVNLTKDTETEQREVTEQVRHEEVDVERDATRRDGTRRDV